MLLPWLPISPQEGAPALIQLEIASCLLSQGSHRQASGVPAADQTSKMDLMTVTSGGVWTMSLQLLSETPCVVMASEREMKCATAEVNRSVNLQYNYFVSGSQQVSKLVAI